AHDDRLGVALAQLDGRLDGVCGRMEGVAGQMAGLGDKLAGLHQRLDQLDHRLDRHELRLGALPPAITGPITECLSGTESALHTHLNEVDKAMRERVETSRDQARHSIEGAATGLRVLLREVDGRLHATLAELAERPTVDPTEALRGLDTRVDSLGRHHQRLDARLDSLDAALGARPDTDTITTLVAEAHHESQRRGADTLDEAMATFAELILGAHPDSTGDAGGHQPPAHPTGPPSRHQHTATPAA
ncbi:MAG: PA containing protein, partial [Actinomycetes bacterium]